MKELGEVLSVRLCKEKKENPSQILSSLRVDFGKKYFKQGKGNRNLVYVVETLLTTVDRQPSKK